MKIIVHPRITERHPEISEVDVLDAWENTIAYLPRLGKDPSQYIIIGLDRKERLIELVANRGEDDTWIIFHGMTPPSRKTLVELRIRRG